MHLSLDQVKIDVCWFTRGWARVSPSLKYDICIILFKRTKKIFKINQIKKTALFIDQLKIDVRGFTTGWARTGGFRVSSGHFSVYC